MKNGVRSDEEIAASNKRLVELQDAFALCEWCCAPTKFIANHYAVTSEGADPDVRPSTHPSCQRGLELRDRVGRIERMNNAHGDILHEVMAKLVVLAPVVRAVAFARRLVRP